MLSDYQTLVNRLVRADADDITAEDIDAAIELAVVRYSQDRPRTVVSEVTFSGSLLVELPDAWDDNFSELLGVGPASEVIGTQNIPAILADTVNGRRIQLYRSLAIGSALLVSHTRRHAVTDLEDTVPLGDREAAANYAASNLFEQLAALHSGATDATIQADSVDHNSKARDYAARARVARTKYVQHLGLSEQRTQMASAVVNLNTTDSRGRDRLFKRGRYR
jgi:hypothetical protein